MRAKLYHVARAAGVRPNWLAKDYTPTTAREALEHLLSGLPGEDRVKVRREVLEELERAHRESGAPLPAWLRQELGH